MENPSSDKVAINNPADITIIVGYFVMVIGVGIWVSVPLLVTFQIRLHWLIRK